MKAKSKAEYRAMTVRELNQAVALAGCKLPPASMTKRFARDLHHQAVKPEAQITDKQAAYLAVCCYRFRRQMPGHLVPAEPPPGYETPTMQRQREEQARLVAAVAKATGS